MRFGIPDLAPTTAGDVLAFRAQSSVLDEQAVLHRVVPEYQLPPVDSCRFFTRGDADIFRLECGAARYYLKVRRPPVSVDRCEAEAALIEHLASGGVAVARAVPFREVVAGRRYACHLQAAEGLRAILIFEEAPPGKPGPLNVEQARDLGAYLANLHAAADAWGGAGLEDFDPGTLVDAVRDLTAAARLSADASGLLSRAVDVVRDAYARIPRTPGDFGPIHGDLAPSNVRIDTAGRYTLFDFGAAERSWRQNELLNAKDRLLCGTEPPSHEDRWAALQAGYTSQRPLPPGMDQLQPAYRLAGRLRMLGYTCNALTLRLGVEVIDQQDFPRSLAEIAAMVEQCDSR